jgi:hypothetical protein
MGPCQRVNETSSGASEEAATATAADFDVDFDVGDSVWVTTKEWRPINKLDSQMEAA